MNRMTTLLLIGLGVAWLASQRRAAAAPAPSPEGGVPVQPTETAPGGGFMPMGPVGPIMFPAGYGQTGGNWRGIGTVPTGVRG